MTYGEKGFALGYLPQGADPNQFRIHVVDGQADSCDVIRPDYVHAARAGMSADCRLKHFVVRTAAVGLSPVTDALRPLAMFRTRDIALNIAAARCGSTSRNFRDED